MYWDANNLYGWAMSAALPQENIQFSNDTTLDEILNTADDSETGYILEVDSSFPEESHDQFKQYPPCLENIKPKNEWLSDCQKEIAEKNGIKMGSCNKLTPHLFDHKHIVISIELKCH